MCQNDVQQVVTVSGSGHDRTTYVQNVARGCVHCTTVLVRDRTYFMSCVQHTILITVSVAGEATVAGAAPGRSSLGGDNATTRATYESAFTLRR